MAKTLVTGAAGFIGFHLSRALLSLGNEVIGVDNLSPYYDVKLKQARLALLRQCDRFRFFLLDLRSPEGLASIFEREFPDGVVHLAAQAGVRHSLAEPSAYLSSNITAFTNLLEQCRNWKVKHLIYASSSSVYGRLRVPVSEADRLEEPLSIYAATKCVNELMACTYSRLYGLPTTGLRLFSIYGPWGRPDSALFIFTRSILENRAVNLFDSGKVQRDFTYVDDAVESIIRLMDRSCALSPDPPVGEWAPWGIYNVGRGRPVTVRRFLELIEENLGIPAQVSLAPMQPGDIPVTCADVNKLRLDTNFEPVTPPEEGIPRCISWFRDYYGF